MPDENGSPTVAEQLRTARDLMAADLVQLSDPARRKLTYSVNGRSVSWTEYRRFLLDGIKELAAQIDAEEADDTGPGELITAIR